jgi:glycine hydroxymethyltransferase
VDVVALLALDRACRLFGANYAKGPPPSGSQASAAGYMASLEPRDTILGMHLAHGARVAFSGLPYRAVQYGPNPDTGLIASEA